MNELLKCLKAMADETRLRIVMLLLREELSVCELMAILEVPQPLVSRHLSILKDAGLVLGRKEGKMHFYRVTDEARRGGRVGLLEFVIRSLRGDPRAAGDRRRLRECRKFEKKAGRCDMETLRAFVDGKAGR